MLSEIYSSTFAVLIAVDSLQLLHGAVLRLGEQFFDVSRVAQRLGQCHIRGQRDGVLLLELGNRRCRHAAHLAQRLARQAFLQPALLQIASQYCGQFLCCIYIKVIEIRHIIVSVK